MGGHTSGTDLGLARSYGLQGNGTPTNWKPTCRLIAQKVLVGQDGSAHNEKLVRQAKRRAKTVLQTR